MKRPAAAFLKLKPKVAKKVAKKGFDSLAIIAGKLVAILGKEAADQARAVLNSYGNLAIAYSLCSGSEIQERLSVNG